MRSKLFDLDANAAPKAQKIKQEFSNHGFSRIDNYYWLKDRKKQEVIDYLEAENKYTKDALAHTEALQEKLYNEIVGRIKKDDSSVPYFKNGYYYYQRYKKGKEYPIFCRKKESLDNPEIIILDQNKLAKEHAFHAIGEIDISPNNKILAYSEDTLSRRIYTIKFIDLTTGEHLANQIENTSGNITWANDNQTVFFTKKDETLRPYQVWRYKIAGKDDREIVFEENDATFYTSVYKTKSNKFIVIASNATVSSEYRFILADNPTETFQIFETRRRDHEYEIAHLNNRWVILTNWEAQNFRVMTCNENNTKRESWQEIISHRDHVLVEEVDLFNDYMVITERINGIGQIRIFDNNMSDHYIDFGEDSFVAGEINNFEPNTEILRLSYTSLTSPNSVFDYNMRTRKLELKKEQEIVGGYDKSEYKSERIYALADDGTKIPISIVYKKGLIKNGENPCLIYGYGSYGHSIEPYFSSVRLSLLDRGFVFAMAHIRGGEEMGRQWYDDGKLLQKKNTFTDFIHCAEFLISENFTSNEKLFAAGGSAGGLLMGAVVNLRPDLWAGILSAVPFVDVINTMLDESIPLTTGEYDEWGNPNEKEYFEYMRSYSPYDNLEAKDYPPQLITTGLHDSQVQYWEPAKYVAKMRELKTDNNPLLLHTDMDTGHGGASGRFERFKETAMEYAFILDLAGVHK